MMGSVVTELSFRNTKAAQDTVDKLELSVCLLLCTLISRMEGKVLGYFWNPVFPYVAVWILTREWEGEVGCWGAGRLGKHGKPQEHRLGSTWKSRTLMTEERSPYFCMTLAYERHHSTRHPLGLFRPKRIGGIIVRMETAVVKRSDGVTYWKQMDGAEESGRGDPPMDRSSPVGAISERVAPPNNFISINRKKGLYCKKN